MCDWLSDEIPFHVVYPSNRHLSSKVRVFVDWVAEILEHHTGMKMCHEARTEREKSAIKLPNKTVQLIEAHAAH
jgi:LysR family transcriptional regulator for bpeEF and oprC